MKLIFRLYYLTLKLLYRIGLLCLVLFQAEGQNLCNSESNPNLIPDGFEIEEGNVGCHPFKVSVKNKLNNARDVQYVYYYGGQSATELKNLNPTSDLSNIYFVESGEKYSDYTILQFGKDENGKDFYSCKNVAVRLSNEPKYSYTICNGSTMEFSIPKDSNNYHNLYEVNWGNGTSEQIPSTSLPYKITKQIEQNQTITITGILDGSINCSTTAVITINGQETKGFGKTDIKMVELIDPTVAQVTFDGFYDDIGYKVYMNLADKPFDFNTPVLKGIKPGTFSVSLPDSTKSYCFVLTREETCGGTDTSPDFCTIPISLDSFDGDNVSLNTSDHKQIFYDILDLPSHFGQREISYSIQGEDINGQTNTKQISINSPYLIENIGCNQKTCFRLLANVTGVLFNRKFDTNILSNRVCVDTINNKPFALENPYTSYNVTGDSLKFSYSPNSNWKAPAQKYYLYEIFSDSSESLIDSSSSQLISIKEDSPSKSRSFFLRYKDTCERLSASSQQLRSSYLKFDQNKSELNIAFGKPFGNHQIEKATIVSFEEDLPGFEYSKEIIPIQDGPMNSDLTPFENLAVFRIKSFRNNQISLSNLLSVPIDTKLFIPDAFSPNGDGINDQFKIYGNLGTIDGFGLKIIDRLGYLVFNSNDPKKYWDGTYKGVSSPPGYYNYIITGITQKGEPIFKQGKLLLLQ